MHAREKIFASTAHLRKTGRDHDGPVPFLPLMGPRRDCGSVLQGHLFLKPIHQKSHTASSAAGSPCISADKQAGRRNAVPISPANQE